MTTPIFQDPRFDALRNAIYHTARGRYVDAVNRFFNFLVIALGATAVGKIAKLFYIGDYWIELGIVLIATIQLVFDFGGRASTHIFLQKRYYDLLAEMEVARTEARKRWSAKLLTIAGDEPIPMRALDALAYNAALDAWTSDPEVLKEHRLYVPWLYRRLRHIIAFQGTQFVPRSQHKGLYARLKNWWTNGIHPSREPQGGHRRDHRPPERAVDAANGPERDHGGMR
jgi:hypothetical protein